MYFEENWVHYIIDAEGRDGFLEHSVVSIVEYKQNPDSLKAIKYSIPMQEFIDWFHEHATNRETTETHFDFEALNYADDAMRLALDFAPNEDELEDDPGMEETFETLTSAYEEVDDLVMLIEDRKENSLI